MDIIQGGPTPVVAKPVENSVVVQAHAAKEPEVKDVKPTAKPQPTERYAARKAAHDDHRGRKVDVEA